MMHGGLGLDHTYFLPWFDSLCSRMEFIYYDHLANGRSDMPSSMAGITHSTWIEDADALRTRLGHDRVILFGHSYGGALALEYALQYEEHLDGLILCCTAPVFDYVDIMLSNAQARGTPEQLEALMRVLGNTLNDDAEWRKMWMTYLPLYFKAYEPAFGAAIDRDMIYRVATQKHANAHCLPTYNVLDRLGRITTPTLVMCGWHDWITPPAEAGERLHAGLPNSELILFEESGHFPFIEETGACMDAIAGWVDRLGEVGSTEYSLDPTGSDP
jgi:proline iminopeptidase